jgi:pyruvate dehydrogenase E1 component alpha subunit
MRKKELIDFEERIKTLFERGKIRAPIHLSGGNEDALIEIFKDYHEGDWIFSTWRNHYHWLLSGRDPGELERQIMAGDSMSVFDARFFTSSIVGGNAPIALGVALAIRLKGSSVGKGPAHPRVWCFLGDMAASGGLAGECIRYAQGHDLPVTYVIEDNGLSVTTDTAGVWGKKKKKKARCYEYKRKHPHAGTGKHVKFD